MITTPAAHHTCHDCDLPIPAGFAVLRSISFERVAFHGYCWDLRRETDAVVAAVRAA